MTTPLRQRAGRPSGGEFASQHRADSAVTLGAEVSEEEVTTWLDRNNLTLDLAGRTMMAEELSAIGTVTDLNRTDAFRTAYQSTNGYRQEDLLAYEEVLTLLGQTGNGALAEKMDRFVGALTRRIENPVSRPKTIALLGIDDDPEVTLDAVPTELHLGAVREDDPFVQSGGIADMVQAADGTVFHRRRDDVFPEAPTRLRIQANRKLTDDDMEQFARLTAYAYASTVRSAEPLSTPKRDSPYSFVVQNTGYDRPNKARLSRFEADLPELIDFGSRMRTTDQKGPGTAGTQATTGFGEVGLTFELYYDSVS